MLRLERTERRLLRRCARREDIDESAIHELADRIRGTEVRCQCERRAEFVEARLDAFVDLDVGAAEPVDALLRIADDEERAGTRRDCLPVASLARLRRQQQADLGLHRIGVLELVHQQVAIPSAEFVAHLAVLTEQLRTEEQQIIESQCAVLVTLAGIVPHRALQRAHHDRVPVLPPLLDDRRRNVGEKRKELGLETLRSLLARRRLGPEQLRHLAAVLAERVEQCAAHDRVTPIRHATMELQPVQCLHQRVLATGRRRDGAHRLSAFHETLQLLEARGRLRQCDIRRGELDIVVLHHRLECVVQVRRIDRARIQRLYIRISRTPHRVDPPAPEFAIHCLDVSVGDLRELRVEADLDRTLAKEPRAERVDRAEERALEVAQRNGTAGMCDRITRPVAYRSLERQLESLAQLIGRLPRECDGGQLLHRRSAQHVLQHPADQRRGLPRPRAGFDDQVRREILRDPIARVLIGHRRTHSFSSFAAPRRVRIDAYSSSDVAFAFAHAARGEVAEYSPTLTRQIAA